MRNDWYTPLSNGERVVWEHSFSEFCDKHKPLKSKALGEIDWWCIDFAQKKHKVPRNKLINDVLVSAFGKRPYRCTYSQSCQPDVKKQTWDPYHSMHREQELDQLIVELEAAEPDIRDKGSEDDIDEFDNVLMPALRKTAKAKRILYVSLDT